MASKYPGSLLEVQEETISKVTEILKREIDPLRFFENIEIYSQEISKKDKIYGKVITKYINEARYLIKDEPELKFFAYSQIFSYKVFELQYLKEKQNMPIIQESTLEKVCKEFPNKNDIGKAILILDRIHEENYEYSKTIHQLIEGFEKIARHIISGCFIKSYAFKYLLLSEQSKKDYETRIKNN
jgi:hypothetical protein